MAAGTPGRLVPGGREPTLFNAFTKAQFAALGGVVGNWAMDPRRIWLALAMLAVVGPSAALAQVYTFTSQGSMNGGTTQHLYKWALYVPENLDGSSIRGIIYMQNGSGEDRRFMASVPWVQAFARSQSCAFLAGDTNMDDQWSSYAIPFTSSNIDDALAAAAAASGRSTLPNAPLLLLGMSMGGYDSSILTQQVPSRVLGFVANKGGVYQYYSTATGTAAVPGMFIAGQTDGAVQPGVELFDGAYKDWRKLNSDQGLVGFAADWNVGHDSEGTPSWDFASVLLSEYNRLRHPGTSLVSGRPALLPLSYSSGYLAERGDFDTSTDAVLFRPTFPAIAPVGSYSSARIPAATASWLPSLAAARAYRGFTSTDTNSISPARTESPKANELQIETPTRFQQITSGRDVVVTVDTRAWRGVNSMSLFVNGTAYGASLTSAPWRWTIPAGTLPAGWHSAVVEASDGSNQRAAMVAFGIIDWPGANRSWTGGAGSGDVFNISNWSSAFSRELPASRPVNGYDFQEVSLDGNVSQRALSTGGGSGSAANATATFSSTAGAVTEIVLSNVGYGYTNAPSVAISGGGGSGASAVADIVPMYAIDYCEVTAGGSGYNAPPAVTFVGGGGSGAAGLAVIDPSGQVSEVILTSRGSGYTSNPTIQFTGGGGSGAAGRGLWCGGYVARIRVTNGGSGYTSEPTVTLTGGGASTPATISYTSITSGQVTGLTLTAAGSGYVSAPAVVIAEPSNSWGKRATATATVSGGVVTGLTLTDPGYGYTGAPAVTLVGGGPPTNAFFTGLDFAPAANGFTFSGWRHLHIGFGGIRNRSAATQTLALGSGGKLRQTGPQTWSAEAGDIAVSAPVTMGGPFSGDGVMRAGDLTLHAESGRAITLSGGIDGYGSITKEGAGSATLSAANTYKEGYYYWDPNFREGLRVHGGTLVLASSASFADSIRLFVAEVPGALLDVGGVARTFASLNGGGTVALGTGGALTLNHKFEESASQGAFGPTQFRGTITGGASGQTSLTLNGSYSFYDSDGGGSTPGSGTFDTTLSGNSTFAGRVQLNSGNLRISSGNALGAMGPGNETLIAGGTQAQLVGSGLDVPEDFVFNTAQSATAVVNAAGSGNNTLSGTLRVPTASTNIDCIIANGAQGTTLTLSGTLTGQDYAGSGGIARAFLRGGTNAVFNVTGTISNPANAALSLFTQKNGAAPTSPTFRLAGTNTFTGGVTHLGGTLIIAANAPSGAPGALGNGTGSVSVGASWGTATNEDLAVLTEGNVTVARGITVNSIAGATSTVSVGASDAASPTFSGAIAANRAVALTVPPGGTASFNGAITGAGPVTKSGAGTVLLNAANTYSGGTTVAEGRLGGTGTISGSVTVSAGAGLVFAVGTAPAAHDKLDIAGSLDLSAADSLAISVPVGGTPATGTYTLLTAAGGITGAIDTLSLPAGWSGSVAVSGNDLRLTVTALPAAPAAPSSPTASAASQTRIDISWADAAGETAYLVQRSTIAGSGFVTIVTLAADTTAYADTGLDGATTYYYRILAANTGGVSTAATASATTLASPPAAPSALQASAYDFANVDLAWTDNAANETGFKIERSTTSGSGFVQIATAGANVTSYRDTGRSPLTTYYYRVRASNSGGDSAYTGEASLTTPSDQIPAAPTELVATSISSSQINIAWADNSAVETAYLVERSLAAGSGYSQIASLAANATGYSETGLNAATTYYYRVRAANAVGNSAYSNEAFTSTQGTATRTWTGASSGLWATAGNWDGGVTVPAFADSVSFPDVTNQTVTLGADRTVTGASFNAADAYAISPGNTLTSLGAITNQGAGSLVINAPLVLGIANKIAATGAGAITLGGAVSARDLTLQANNTATSISLTNTANALAGTLILDGIKATFAAGAYPAGLPVVMARTQSGGTPQLYAGNGASVGAVNLGAFSGASRWLYANGSGADVAFDGVISGGNPANSVELGTYGANTTQRLNASNNFVASLVRINPENAGYRLVLGHAAALGAATNAVRLGNNDAENRGAALLLGAAGDVTQPITVQHQNFDNGGAGASRPVLGGTGSSTGGRFTGAITLDHNAAPTGTPTLVLRHDTADGAVTFAGPIGQASGDTWGVSVEGAGTVRLDAANNFTGTTTVQSGGTLGGTGSIAGALVLASGGRFAVALAAAPSFHDKFEIGGTLTFGGSNTLAITAGESVSAGTYTLITAAGGIVGALPALSLPAGWSAILQTSGNDLQLVVVSTGLTPLQNWRQSHFGTTANSGDSADDADPDGDGLPNLVEYALDTDPRNFSGGDPHGPVSATGSGYLTLTFLRARPDATYIVQASSDLDSWSNVAVNPGTVGQTATVTDTEPLSSTPRRFIRLKISSP